MYKLLKQEGRAKRGEFHTVHGVIQTPVFMNVGTVAAIKGAVSTADLEQIRAAGYDVITPVIICNTPDFPDMVCHIGMQVKPADPIITL